MLVKLSMVNLYIEHNSEMMCFSECGTTTVHAKKPVPQREAFNRAFPRMVGLLHTQYTLEGKGATKSTV